MEGKLLPGHTLGELFFMNIACLDILTSKAVCEDFCLASELLQTPAPWVASLEPSGRG